MRDGLRGLGRRRFLTAGGAAAFAGAITPLGLTGRAVAEDTDVRGRRHQTLRDPQPIPSPIPGGIPTGLPEEHPLSFVHWFLPGPPNAVTPVLGLPGMGLDVEPSTITNYEGFTAFAVVAGEARDDKGNDLLVEFDVRVMDGVYIAEDGSRRHAAFAFF